MCPSVDWAGCPANALPPIKIDRGLALPIELGCVARAVYSPHSRGGVTLAEAHSPASVSAVTVAMTVPSVCRSKGVRPVEMVGASSASEPIAPATKARRSRREGAPLAIFRWLSQ